METTKLKVPKCFMSFQLKQIASFCIRNSVSSRTPFSLVMPHWNYKCIFPAAGELVESFTLINAQSFSMRNEFSIKVVTLNMTCLLFRKRKLECNGYFSNKQLCFFRSLNDVVSKGKREETLNDLNWWFEFLRVSRLETNVQVGKIK